MEQVPVRQEPARSNQPQFIDIFVPLHVPSSKNSRRIVSGKRKDGTKFTRSIHSESVEKYKKNSALIWKTLRKKWLPAIEGLPFPLKVGFHFVRATRHKYDWINPLQTVQDEMVRHGWIEDDNTDFLLPYPFDINGQWSTVDKENAGVWIRIAR